MDETEIKIRKLRDLLYAGRDISLNFTILCELMRPRIMWRARPFVRDMEG